MKKKTLPVYDITAFNDLAHTTRTFMQMTSGRIYKQNQGRIPLPHGHDFYQSCIVYCG